MDNATHADQDGEVSWASLTPEQRGMLSALLDPGLFAVVVDSLPPSRARYTLRHGGMVRGHYPITEETKRAVTDELMQLIDLEKSGGAPDSR